MIAKKAQKAAIYIFIIFLALSINFLSCMDYDKYPLIKDNAVLIEPYDKVEFDVETNTFKWKSIDGVDRYKLFINDLNVYDGINNFYKTKDISILKGDKHSWYVKAANPFKEVISEKREFYYFTGEFTLLEPNNKSNLCISNPTLEFEYSAKDSTNFKIILSNESSFENVLYTFNISNTDTSTKTIKYKIKNNLNNGIYYWKVQAENEGFYSEYSKSFVFTVNKIEDIIITEPANNSNKCDLDFNFAWNKISDIESYILEVSITSDFKEILFTQETENNEIDNPFSFESNIYFARVSAKTDLCTGKYSNIVEFSVVEYKNPIKETEVYHECSTEAKLYFNKELKDYITSIELDGNTATIQEDSAIVNISGWSPGNYTWIVEISIYNCPKTYELDTTINQGCGTSIGVIGNDLDGWNTSYSVSGGNSYKQFYYPNGIFVDASGDIYIAETYNNRISKWDSAGNAIGWIGGGSNTWKTSGVSASGNDVSSFNAPLDVFVDASGDIYVADSINERICKWDSAGNAIGWIGGGSNGWQSSSGALTGNTLNSFNMPSGIHVDASGDIYVADRRNHRISKWDSGGNAIGWFGNTASGWKLNNGSVSGTSFQSLNNPTAVFVDSLGNIFISDYANHRICKWTSAATAIGWIGGGSDGWKTTETIGASGKDYRSFYLPHDVFVDDSDVIYIADKNNHRICKWDSTGKALGWFGSGTIGLKRTNNVNPGTTYMYFNFPTGLFVDSLKHVFVVNYTNHNVSKWK